MREVVKPVVAKAHQRCHTAFQYTEHGCAVLYAVCEFGNAHFILIAVSGLMLLAIGGVVVAQLMEKFL